MSRIDDSVVTDRARLDLHVVSKDTGAYMGHPSVTCILHKPTGYVLGFTVSDESEPGASSR